MSVLVSWCLGLAQFTASQIRSQIAPTKLSVIVCPTMQSTPSASVLTQNKHRRCSLQVPMILNAESFNLLQSSAQAPKKINSTRGSIKKVFGRQLSVFVNGAVQSFQSKAHLLIIYRFIYSFWGLNFFSKTRYRASFIKTGNSYNLRFYLFVRYTRISIGKMRQT